VAGTEGFELLDHGLAIGLTPAYAEEKLNFRSLITVFLSNIFMISMIASLGAVDTVLADESKIVNQIIDDRSSGDLRSTLGTEWRLVTDQVMGGISDGNLMPDNYLGKDCLRMRGSVSTKNNGGFVQMALPLTSGKYFDASAYEGVELEVAGNDELYNIHFRTSDLWLPWQSYRFSFKATVDWQVIRISFTDITAYKTTTQFRKDRVNRIGLLGIGRDFQADLCLASIKFYPAVQALK